MKTAAILHTAVEEDLSGGRGAVRHPCSPAAALQPSWAGSEPPVLSHSRAAPLPRAHEAREWIPGQPGPPEPPHSSGVASCPAPHHCSISLGRSPTLRLRQPQVLLPGPRSPAHTGMMSARGKGRGGMKEDNKFPGILQSLET